MLKDIKVKKLVEEAEEIIAKRWPKKQGRHRTTNGIIRPHKVKGKTYYYYCLGTEKEIYLGTAETILKKVKGG